MVCRRSRANFRQLLVAGASRPILPDLDVAAFALGIPYADALGHRGASHSLLFAGSIALLGAALHSRCAPDHRRLPLWLFVCAASHPLLDALPRAAWALPCCGRGTMQRFFAPWRPILVSPFANGFFSARGMATLLSELRWVWLPLFAGATLWKLIQREGARGPQERL